MSLYHDIYHYIIVLLYAYFHTMSLYHEHDIYHYIIVLLYIYYVTVSLS